MDRLEKNKNIAQTMKETYAKRKFQVCKCFKFKIDKSNLSKEQANQLKMQFVEAKWIYNFMGVIVYGYLNQVYPTIK